MRTFLNADLFEYAVYTKLVRLNGVLYGVHPYISGLCLPAVHALLSLLFAFARSMLASRYNFLSVAE